MNPRARGFSLIELLIVSVMLVVIMGAVYKTLISQQQSTRHLSAIISTQQTNRTTAQFLAGEMRELGTTLAKDVVAATADSIRFRALRKVAFVCNVAGGGATLTVFSLGDQLIKGDSILVYADWNTADLTDDRVVLATISDKGTGSACVAPAAGPDWAAMKYASYVITVSPALTTVAQGATVRSFEQVAYGRYVKGSDTVFGRTLGSDTAVTLIGPLSSGTTGFSLQYFDASGTSLAAPVSATDLPKIARVRVSIQGESKGAVTKTGTYSAPLVTDISLRGN